MKIHIIGTVNGLTNEGMRNVATHLAKCFEKDHEVRYSSLKSIISVWKNTRRSDVTIVFARANSRVYWLLRFLEKRSGNLWLVCVQKPMEKFLSASEKRPLRCGCFYLSPADVEALKLGAGKYPFRAGIKLDKFTPVDAATQAALKRKYGFDENRPVAVHVGHCSAGRGLEAFLAPGMEDYQRLVVASGMFEDPDTVARLEAGGVRIHRGYLEHIEEIYRLADVYLFPTRSNEFVISVPLSVMEALACGTPVVGFRDFDNLALIPSVKGGIALVESAGEISAAASTLMKGPQCLLADPASWETSADCILDVIRSNME